MGRLIAIAVLVLAMPSSSLAQPSPEPDPAPPSSGPPDPEARARFIQGETAYAEGRYEDAIAAFESSFELSGRPLLLFNLANAYERLARYGEAADRLRRYLRDARSSEKVALRKRIARLDERAARRDAELAEIQALRARPEVCPVCVATSARLAAEDSGKVPRRWGYGLIATSGVAITSGIVFGVLARDANRDAKQHCSDDSGPLLCTSAADDSLARERRYSLAADLSVGLGIAAAGAGAYLVWRSMNVDADVDASERAAVAPSVGRNFAGVSVVGRF